MNHRKFSTNVIRVSLLLRMINYILLYNVSLRFVSLQGEKERAGGGGEREEEKETEWGKRLFCFIYIKYFT